MGEEEPANEVPKTESNGNSMQEKTLDDINKKKDLEVDGGRGQEKCYY